MSKMKRVGGAYRRIGAMLCAVLLCSSAMAAMQDMVLRFSTPGPDRYADGSIVADGECYALVWSPKGQVFAGFNADGTAVSSADRVVLAGALARDGKCRDSIFQIPAEQYAELEGGEWAVCLVDTRRANGVHAGVRGNAPLRVNRWGVVNSGVKIEPSSVSVLKLAAATKSTSDGLRGISAMSDDGACAGTLSAVPNSVARPRITAFDMADGVVRLTVEDTVPFLTYTISSGSNPAALTTDAAADWVDGDTARPIAIETEASGSSQFFKVTRAE